MDNLLTAAVFSLPSTDVAAGQAETDGNTVDMAGFDEVTFVAALQDISSTGTAVLKVQESATNNGSDWADISGATTGTQTDKSDKLLIVSVYRPQMRYVRPVLTTAVANGAINAIIAIQTQPKKQVTSQSSDVAKAVLVAPTA